MKLSFDEAVIVYILSVSGFLPMDNNHRQSCLPQDTSVSLDDNERE